MDLRDMYLRSMSILERVMNDQILKLLSKDDAMDNSIQANLALLNVIHNHRLAGPHFTDEEWKELQDFLACQNKKKKHPKNDMEDLCNSFSSFYTKGRPKSFQMNSVNSGNLFHGSTNIYGNSYGVYKAGPTKTTIKTDGGMYIGTQQGNCIRNINSIKKKYRNFPEEARSFSEEAEWFFKK